MLEAETGAEDHSEDTEIPTEADLGVKEDWVDLAAPILIAITAVEGDTGAMNAHHRNKLRQTRPRSRSHLRSTRGISATNQMEIGMTGRKPRKWHPHL